MSASTSATARRSASSGESGCGKSVTALSIARLVPDPPGRIVAGEIMFDGINILKLSNSNEMRHLRGKEIGFIFQDPLTSLNPTLTIGYQIAESIREHMGLSEEGGQPIGWSELLSKVGIPRAKDRLNDYPHQFSGGMRQRVMIAIALSCDPKLILADEPTTALDVTIQAQILELIQRLSDEFHTAVLLITHDLGIAAGMCDRINVMYAGRIVETGTVDELFEEPRMPYAWGLLDSLPRLDDVRGDRLRTIEGLPPLLIDPPDRCRFEPRCRFARDICREKEPEPDRAVERSTLRDAGQPRPTDGSRDHRRREAPKSTEAIAPDLVEAEDLEGPFPDPVGPDPEARSERSRPSMASRSRSAEGRPSGSSANRAVARARRAGPLIRLRDYTSGTVKFDGIDLASLKSGPLRKMRRRMQIIFQDPYGSLDPRMTVGATIAEPIDTHNLASGAR